MKRWQEDFERELLQAYPLAAGSAWDGDERELPLVRGRPAIPGRQGGLIWPILICGLTGLSLVATALVGDRAPFEAASLKTVSDGLIPGRADGRAELAISGSGSGSAGGSILDHDEAGRVSALPYYRTAALTPEWLSDGVADAPDMHRTGAFSLVDQNDEVVTEADLSGRLTVANFFFTQCTGICPTTRAQMGWVREQFEGDDRLVMLSHSVTPEHDSHDVLHDYAHVHQVAEGWHLLTGTEADILEVASRDFFVNLRDGTGYGVDDLQHTENVVLLDSQRRIRGVYNGTLRVDMQQLVEDIRVLMAEG